MMTMEFDDNLITGNDMIDTQHKELIDRIRKFVDSCEDGSGAESAAKMLDYLSEYTDFHFGEEEKLQESVEYPGLPQHRVKHEEFKKTLEDLKKSLADGGAPTDEFVKKVETSVVNWLFYHIKTFDRSVAEFIFMREHPDRL